MSAKISNNDPFIASKPLEYTHECQNDFSYKREALDFSYSDLCSG